MPVIKAAAINVRANNVVLPGPARLAVGSAVVDADVTLYDQPHIVADVQIADRRLRRISSLHSLTAFVFNTVILALGVNFAITLIGA